MSTNTEPVLINAEAFCNLQGVSKYDRFTIEKKYTNLQKTYEDWHSFLSNDFILSEAKQFTPAQEEAAQEQIVEENIEKKDDESIHYEEKEVEEENK